MPDTPRIGPITTRGGGSVIIHTPCDCETDCDGCNGGTPFTGYSEGMITGTDGSVQPQCGSPGTFCQMPWQNIAMAINTGGYAKPTKDSMSVPTTGWYNLSSRLDAAGVATGPGNPTFWQELRVNNVQVGRVDVQNVPGLYFWHVVEFRIHVNSVFMNAGDVITTWWASINVAGGITVGSGSDFLDAILVST